MTNWDAVFFVLLCVSVATLVLVDSRNFKLAATVAAIGAYLAAVFVRRRTAKPDPITLEPDQIKREKKHGDTDAEIRALDESAELLPDLPDDVDRERIERLRAKLARRRKNLSDNEGSANAD